MAPCYRQQPLARQRLGILPVFYKRYKIENYIFDNDKSYGNWKVFISCKIVNICKNIAKHKGYKDRFYEFRIYIFLGLLNLLGDFK